MPGHILTTELAVPVQLAVRVDVAKYGILAVTSTVPKATFGMLNEQVCADAEDATSNNSNSMAKNVLNSPPKKRVTVSSTIFKAEARTG